MSKQVTIKFTKPVFRENRGMLTLTMEDTGVVAFKEGEERTVHEEAIKSLDKIGASYEKVSK